MTDDEVKAWLSEEDRHAWRVDIDGHMFENIETDLTPLAAVRSTLAFDAEYVGRFPGGLNAGSRMRMGVRADARVGHTSREVEETVARICPPESRNPFDAVWTLIASIEVLPPEEGPEPDDPAYDPMRDS